ncbi:hypothetical protein Emtol_0450 [Emticicia oligotrophica DSM 17448]|uniref:Uncharacterized protein n=1 Tax=Emticicia oligotrophica (strain DSM 17448 / CIP 109782 / MTCC 6937 / GPTSA100-15) TaxID=929562 RepID=A0ABM5MWS3_EMTOG|nr:hypothetical protein [Emticicia oligotrophica]AFK01604.1 hypothetical protein Emtol_0450 [Emticicia oligotrophica DSM 17448]
MASFNIDFPGTSNQFVVNATKAIQSKGGVFEGDASNGLFSLQTLVGSIKGTYLVISELNSSPTKIAITITKKPLIVPMSKIQEVIASYF